MHPQHGMPTWPFCPQPGFEIEIKLDTEEGVYKFAAYRQAFSQSCTPLTRRRVCTNLLPTGKPADSRAPSCASCSHLRLFTRRACPSCLTSQRAPFPAGSARTAGQRSTWIAPVTLCGPASCTAPGRRRAAPTSRRWRWAPTLSSTRWPGWRGCSSLVAGVTLSADGAHPCLEQALCTPRPPGLSRPPAPPVYPPCAATGGG